MLQIWNFKKWNENLIKQNQNRTVWFDLVPYINKKSFGTIIKKITGSWFSSIILKSETNEAVSTFSIEYQIGNIPKVFYMAIISCTIRFTGPFNLKT